MSNVTCAKCDHRVYTQGKEIQSICALTNEYVWSYVQLSQISKKCPLSLQQSQQTSQNSSIVEPVPDLELETPFKTNVQEQQQVSTTFKPEPISHKVEIDSTSNPISHKVDAATAPSQEQVSQPLASPEVQIEGNWPDALEAKPELIANEAPVEIESKVEVTKPDSTSQSSSILEQKPEQKKFEYNRQNKGKRQ